MTKSKKKLPWSRPTNQHFLDLTEDLYKDLDPDDPASIDAYLSELTDTPVKKEPVKEEEMPVDDTVRRDDPEFPAILRFALARKRGLLESVRDLFDPDVTLVCYEWQTLHGVDAVLSFWQSRYDSQVERGVDFKYRIVPCMLYNGIAIREIPEGFQESRITFLFRDGKIALMALSPDQLSDITKFYGGFKEAPFTEAFFSRYFTGDLKPEPNRLPCYGCGELSENLSWHSFDHNNWNFFTGMRGEVSVCPHCHRTVELKPTEQYDRSQEDMEQHPKPFFPKMKRPVVGKPETEAEVLAEVAREYIFRCLPACCAYYHKGGKKGTTPNDLFAKYLPHLHFPEGTRIEIDLASEDHDHFGDLSNFVLVAGSGEKSEAVCHYAGKIMWMMTVEKSVRGAWELYLFNKESHLLPTFWHGGYASETLIFGREDLELVPSLDGIALDVVLNVLGDDDLRPRVHFEGDTAIVESHSWSEWGGLYRETVRITFDGNTVKAYEELEAKNLYSYDCGIMF